MPRRNAHRRLPRVQPPVLPADPFSTQLASTLHDLRNLNAYKQFTQNEQDPTATAALKPVLTKMAQDLATQYLQTGHKADPDDDMMDRYMRRMLNMEMLQRLRAGQNPQGSAIQEVLTATQTIATLQTEQTRMAMAREKEAREERDRAKDDIDAAAAAAAQAEQEKAAKEASAMERFFEQQRTWITEQGHLQRQIQESDFQRQLQQVLANQERILGEKERQITTLQQQVAELPRKMEAEYTARAQLKELEHKLEAAIADRNSPDTEWQHLMNKVGYNKMLSETLMGEKAMQAKIDLLETIKKEVPQLLPKVAELLDRFFGASGRAPDSALPLKAPPPPSALPEGDAHG